MKANASTCAIRSKVPWEPGNVPAQQPILRLRRRSPFVQARSAARDIHIHGCRGLLSGSAGLVCGVAYWPSGDLDLDGRAAR